MRIASWLCFGVLALVLEGCTPVPLPPGVEGGTMCDGPCPCAADTDCSGATPRCDKNSGACVACLPLNDNCPAGSRCVANNNSFTCSSSCATSADCPKSDAGVAAQCCNSVCIDTASDTGNCGGCGKTCPTYPNASAVCINGSCALGPCAAGYADCDNLPGTGCESNVTTDVKNCGACAKACVAGANAMATCAASKCTSVCAPGFADCAMTGSCTVAVASDPMNCGMCGNVCQGTPNATVGCMMSTCAITGCKFGYADCDKNPNNGCEASLLDAASCGLCGNVCAAPPNASPACNAGVCGIGMCAPNFGDCNNSPADGCEKSLANDVGNCGMCRNVCMVPNGTPACLGGQCGVASCNMFYGDCNKMPADGCESFLPSDANNCGACNHACPAPANASGICVNGACNGIACNPGYADCNMNMADGCETDIRTPAHCGGCNTACPVPANATAGCTMGMCGIGKCNAGYADCNNNPADGCEKSVAADVQNCGGCGMVCALPNANVGCLNGQCGFVSCLPNFSDCDGKPANGCEVSLLADNNNCGMCGSPCPMFAPYCNNGVCGVDDFPPIWFYYYTVDQ